MRHFASTMNIPALSPVERIGKGGSFRVFQLNGLVDLQGAMGMRHDQRNAAPHFLIDHLFARENREQNREA